MRVTKTTAYMYIETDDCFLKIGPFDIGKKFTNEKAKSVIRQALRYTPDENYPVSKVQEIVCVFENEFCDGTININPEDVWPNRFEINGEEK